MLHSLQTVNLFSLTQGEPIMRKLLIEEVLAWLSSLSAGSVFLYYLILKRARKLLKWVFILALIAAYFYLRSAGILIYKGANL